MHRSQIHNSHTHLRMGRQSAARALIGAIVAGAWGTAAAQTCPNAEVATVITDGTVADGRLGSSLAVSADGTRAAAGRPGDGSSPIVGAVLTYTYDDVSAEWQLDPGPPVQDQGAQPGDSFGSSVAIANGIMAVGAPGRLVSPFVSAGSVSIFEWNAGTSTWDWVSRITQPSGVQADARFGESVDLQHEPGIGWTLIVGAPGTLLFPTEPDIGGRAFVLSNQDAGNMASPWVLEADLGILSVGALGESVAISGPYAVVGDPIQDSLDGGAFIYERTGGVWDSTSVFEVPSSGNGAEAGFAVDIEGTTAVIGSPGAVQCTVADPPSCFTPAVRGEVRVVERTSTGWTETSIVRSLDEGVGIRFGSAVKLSEGRLAVGAVAGGTIALYGRSATDEWYATTLASVTDPTAPPVPGFGGAVAMASGSRGLLGGWSDDSDFTTNGGSVARWDPAADCNGNLLPDECEAQFDMAVLDCDGNALLDSCEIEADPTLDCNMNGILDSCEIAEDGSLVDINDNGILDVCEGPDCNGNEIADAIELRSVEIVWIIDTSGSQVAKFSDVCDIITALEADLRSDADPSMAVYDRSRYLTLGSVPPGGLPCDTTFPFETFQDVFGNDLTGLDFPAPTLPTVDESWSAATAIAARDNEWQTNLRIVIPISDECGWDNLAPCGDDDEDAIEAARDFLQCVDVMAFPIQFEEDDLGWIGDVLIQMRKLAGEFREQPTPPDPLLGTGGQAFTLEGSTPELVAAALAGAIRDSLPIHDNDANGVLDDCEFDSLPAGSSLQDCNANWIDDAFEIRADIGMSLESSAIVGLPAECDVPCLSGGDVGGDRRVTFDDDLLPLLAAWGPCPPGPCPTDVDGNGSTDFEDLLAVLADWGWCFRAPDCDPDPRPRVVPPASIMDCLDRFGADPVRLQACIEAMFLAETP